MNICLDILGPFIYHLRSHVREGGDSGDFDPNRNALFDQKIFICRFFLKPENRLSLPLTFQNRTILILLEMSYVASTRGC